MNGEGADQVNASQTKRLTGRIAAEHIKLMAVPRPPQGTVERLIALGDATGIISDTLDELGIASGVIGASMLKPTIPGCTVVGPEWRSEEHTSELQSPMELVCCRLLVNNRTS